ncbi:hypothetical protein BFP77_03965 [Maribacter sp. 4U21]|uniref:hypothetical protein n=1 Tax=Maribacter sp. 4U21 TaxID=1889779 RepID=UPI000C159AD8|nr:hypothetical protein [Maribacter sp. 4U21]PIB30726.1 hypothetical protein BFP77_03965 [Maribacter sp. 4U21]
MSLETLDQKITEKSPLEFGLIFSESVALFKKVWLQGFITLLLTLVTILPFYIMIYIPMIAAGITDPDMLRNEEMPPMVVVAMVLLMPVFLLGVMTFGIALNAAFLRICRQKDNNEVVSEDYFYFFKDGRLGKIVIVALIMLGLSLLGSLLCGLGILYVIVPMSLFPAFLAFNEELNAMDTVKASFTLGNKNWLVIFGLLIVMGIVAELGIILCCVGVLFTAMLSKIPTYYIYKYGVGFDSLNE